MDCSRSRNIYDNLRPFSLLLSWSTCPQPINQQEIAQSVTFSVSHLSACVPSATGDTRITGPFGKKRSQGVSEYRYLKPQLIEKLQAGAAKISLK